MKSQNLEQIVAELELAVTELEQIADNEKEIIKGVQDLETRVDQVEQEMAVNAAENSSLEQRVQYLQDWIAAMQQPGFVGCRRQFRINKKDSIDSNDNNTTNKGDSFLD
eukprot:UN01877